MRWVRDEGVPETTGFRWISTGELPPVGRRMDLGNAGASGDAELPQLIGLGPGSLRSQESDVVFVISAIDSRGAPCLPRPRDELVVGQRRLVPPLHEVEELEANWRSQKVGSARAQHRANHAPGRAGVIPHAS